jgi:DNA repair protein RecO (recombination protein O)
MFEKTEAIVIRTFDYKETHKIVTLMTKRFGKIAVIAQGAKKPKSRNGAISQMFIQGDFLLRVGKGLGTLQQGDVIHSFRKVREDLFKTAYASYMTELTYRVLDEHTPLPFIYDQLLKTLVAIEQDKNPEVVTKMYEMKLYPLLGIKPILDHCQSCGTTETLTHFSIGDGGALCQTCGNRDGYSLALNPQVIKLMRLFLEVDVNRVENISVKPENIQLINQVLKEYFEYHSGVFLKSRRFLDQLDALK